MIINGVEVDRDKFIGRVKVGKNGKVQVVTVLSDGMESIKWASWQEIKQAVEEVEKERAEDAAARTDDEAAPRGA